MAHVPFNLCQAAVPKYKSCLEAASGPEPPQLPPGRVDLLLGIQIAGRQGHKNALRKSKTGQSGQVLLPQLPVLLSIVLSEITLFQCSVLRALVNPAPLQLLTAVPAQCINQLYPKLDCYPAILIAQLLEPLVAALTTLVKPAQAGAPNPEAALIRIIQPKPA